MHVRVYSSVRPQVWSTLQKPQLAEPTYLGLAAGCGSHSKAVGDGRRALKYLAPYVFRVAISDHRIVSVEGGPEGSGQVTFGYRKSGSNRWRKMTVSAEEFLRRFLQHVLPRGFQKVRHYGFASARQQGQFEHVRWLVTLAFGLTYLLTSRATQSAEPCRQTYCEVCGHPLRLIGFLPPINRLDTS